MAIHLNPFRLYKGRLCLNHGLIVEILRNTHFFLLAYKNLLEINGKRESDVKELKTIMKKAGIKTRKKISGKEKAKLITEVAGLFSKSLEDIDKMLKSLKTIILDDETFLFRAVKEMRKLYMKFSRIKHIPEHMMINVHERFHKLMENMAEVQKHAWIISKAHARERVKLEEIEIFSTWVMRRRIRRQTIELDHIRNRIEPLTAKVEKLRFVKTHEDIHILHTDISELLRLYHEEMHDLKRIMHESDVIIRRTENLFKAIEREAEPLGMKILKKNIKSYSKKFRKLLLDIEKLSRREHLEISKIVKSLPSVPRHVAKAA
jgi:hypothetical protein